ncbi:hypothetical protein [Pseudobacteroides cellulosolvens]|uniref:Uncharacterized protein n=1 Tax=Pseudobacteroides cellulosolvens ATCC 35603 = DSM 2933 TaxID=398512 RepID=A0A0L6JVK8_9FIRM|nr:hypothetical protein [Pseudobacteroides cellulosolvens]KNY29863.1 hypothetical protein Bccel_5140 [Pseudobacteroides cellulosolvens ATCC 35603 = DSM 2933]
MKLLRHSMVNAIFIGTMSAVYSFLFIITSNHIEFLRLLSNTNTLQSDFWNSWSYFIRVGNMKYVGYVIIVLALIIILFILFKPTKKYDEYQISILSKSIIVAGLISILMLPIIVILLLSDPSYAIETIFLFAVFQWLGVLVTDLIYVIKY